MTQLPPLALYIHIPWCVRKCPYCDFNSHALRGEIPYRDYINALLEDLNNDQWMAQGRKISSIFIGGGTPSLFPAWAIAEILSGADAIIGIETEAEITMEANPGTVEHHDFHELRATGVNRLSLGVQSFDTAKLAALGRIHSADDARNAIQRAIAGGFDNFNVDLMHGLPGQSCEQACTDLETAISLKPTHISWYQLTIEQNTEFYSRPPSLPCEDILVDIFEAGQSILHDAGFLQYEVSAYSKNDKQSKHNLNYWQFGDYLALGAGAHGKITDTQNNTVFRYQKTRLPQDYLNTSKTFTAKTDVIDNENLSIEFMMNALRLNKGASFKLYEERTGAPSAPLRSTLLRLQNKGLMDIDGDTFAPTKLGRKFLNNLLEEFLDI